MSEEIGNAFLDAARTTADLVRDAAVIDAWTSPSALEGMTVGAVACHLGDQVLNARRLVAAPSADGELIAMFEHYARASWIRSGHEGEANVGIRTGSAERAEAGPESLQRELEEAIGELPGVLAGKDPSDPVLVPWQGWCLTRDDLLVTRMMEIVVHADDLACSVGLETPTFPEAVMEPVLRLLVHLSVRKHGQAPVVRALSRKERAPGDITAF